MPTMPPIMQRLPMTELPEMPDAARDHGVRADAAVVADLHVVVELDAVFDDGVLERAAVHGRVRADLDVVADHDAAELRHLDVVPSTSGAWPKPSPPITAPGLNRQRAPMQHAVAQRDARLSACLRRAGAWLDDAARPDEQRRR